MRGYVCCLIFILLATFIASCESQESKRTRPCSFSVEQITPTVSINRNLDRIPPTCTAFYYMPIQIDSSEGEPPFGLPGSNGASSHRNNTILTLTITLVCMIIIPSLLAILIVGITIIRRRKQRLQARIALLNGFSSIDSCSAQPIMNKTDVPPQHESIELIELEHCQIQNCSNGYYNVKQDHHEEDDSGIQKGKEDCDIDSLYTALRILYVDTVERVTFDSKGGSYFSEQHGISLHVPPDAIPDGASQSITIEIGVSFGFPIPFPTGMKPVSPLLAMCVIENHNYQFLKPVEVKLPHCLDVGSKSDEKNLEIQFVKSAHNLSQFRKTKGDAVFTECEGTLKTNHFCFFCIVANKDKVDLSNVNYRLLKVVPKSLTSFRWKIRYCITYFFPTCLRAVAKQYNSEEYDIQSLLRFKFSESAYVEVNFERQTSGGWKLALENSEKIYAKDVDFWDIDSFELEQMELEELYPPRFLIDVCGTEALNAGHVWIKFTGMATDFKSELILDRGEVKKHICLDTQSVTEFSQSFESRTSVMFSLTNSASSTQVPSPSLTSSSGYSSSLDYSSEPRHQDLMNKVAVNIPDKWMLFGIQLGLDQRQLDLIEQKRLNVRDPHLYFSAVFTEWKERMTSPYLWSTIITALESQLIGENRLAEELRREM